MDPALYQPRAVRRPPLLITGGAGYLGRRLVRMALEWDVHATYHVNRIDTDPQATWHQLNLHDRDATLALVRQVGPRAIIHTAPSNRKPEHVDAIVDAARHITEAAALVGARFVHVSTDMVFDGTAAPYAEDAALSPLLPYGEVKAEAERIVTSRLPDAAIVRPSLIFGHEPFDPHFRWLMNAVHTGEEITLFADEYRSPVWVDNLCYALLELAVTDFRGPLHIGSPVPLTRHAFGLALLRVVNLEPTPNIRAGSAEALGLKRPRNLTLEVGLASRTLRTPLLTVAEAAQRMQSRLRAFGPYK